MNYAKLGLVACALATAGAFAVACSSSSSGSANGNDGGSSGSSGSSNPQDGGAAAVSGLPRSKCQAPSTCTEAEINPYNACVAANCKAEVAAAYGNDVSSGTYGGACATYYQCAEACACGDAACSEKCAPSYDEACSNATLAIYSCLQKAACALPRCAVPPLPDAGQSGKTCADLHACCEAMLPDNPFKPACEHDYDSAQNTSNPDQFCGQSYASYEHDCH